MSTVVPIQQGVGHLECDRPLEFGAPNSSFTSQEGRKLRQRSLSGSVGCMAHTVKGLRKLSRSTIAVYLFKTDPTALEGCDRAPFKSSAAR
ncbi:hypothetical protein H6F50_25520 [Coleofasciculus sp. FACHB-712]|uniref:hypothetical protein n=1 Tax=Coleofasciculus sp. FACHB-712 TaxID=2692789 RepID=UPI001685451A|nr:hypothetical protein [Coleofasciculus sp. FACHB-712]MBD1945671.1 hypothetical protein [Coleofasciculus sp. FACHB-712]